LLLELFAFSRRGILIHRVGIDITRKIPHFNFVTKYLPDKSRQDSSSELKEASAE